MIVVTSHQLLLLLRAIHSATPCATKEKAKALREAARDNETKALWDVVHRMIRIPTGHTPRRCGCRGGTQ